MLAANAFGAFPAAVNAWYAGRAWRFNCRAADTRDTRCRCRAESAAPLGLPDKRLGMLYGTPAGALAASREKPAALLTTGIRRRNSGYFFSSM